jgi:DNA-directed RNA polymerase sigma subunit (sigma70/sigma32)
MLKAYYGIAPFTQEYSLTDIAQSQGISKEKVRIAIQKGIQIIKHPNYSRALRSLY